ncbi:MAG: Cell surface protein [Ignavibacteriae bacterium]|nr:MAG: Cell surface protein [Ignavibacteriota bacterium]
MSKFNINLIILFFLVSSVVFAQTVPLPPENLNVTATVEGYAKLMWDYPNIMGIKFKIYKSVDDSPFAPLPAVVQMKNFMDMNVPAGHVYRYYVTAFNSFGESQPSNDVTFIPGQTPPPPMFRKGFIQGNIVDDSTGLPIKGVRVRFYTPDGLLYFREACTDTFGNYFAPLDSGTYLIYATKWCYVPEWYDDVLTREEATPVTIVPNDTTTANFDLRHTLYPTTPVLVSVSGTVIDSVTGLPIKDALVVFLRTNRQMNMMMYQNGTLMGSRDEMFFVPPFGTLIGVVGKAKTDNDGNYTVLLQKNITYIAVAVKIGYIPEFYNNKSSPLDADRLFIVSDTSGINFDLIQNPNVQNSLSGIVKDVDGIGVLSRVVLFQKTPKGIHPVRFTVTDTTGNYYFNYLYSGYYYAKAIPFTLYAPAWYDANPDSCGVFCWVNADSFLVQGATENINICVVPYQPAGFASISGTVSATSKVAGVQSATVYVVDVVSKKIAGYDITEEDGSFSINYLAPGTYQIIADKEGYTIDSKTYELNATNNYKVTDAELLISGTALGIGEEKEIPARYYLSQNYPNPFNPTTEIKFGIPALSKVTLSIYNLLGQRVNVLLSTELSGGNYSVSWDGTDTYGRALSSGLYFYKLDASSINDNGKFTSVRKMLLVR